MLKRFERIKIRKGASSMQCHCVVCFDVKGIFIHGNFILFLLLHFSSYSFLLRLSHMHKPEDRLLTRLLRWAAITHMWAAAMNTQSKYVFWSIFLVDKKYSISSTKKNCFPLQKGLYGQNVVSSYSKAVDSAHSSVRVSSSRQSNDVLGKQINV